MNSPGIFIMGVIAIYAVFWAYYGLVHFRVPRQGLGALGWAAVTVGALATVFFIVYGFIGEPTESITGLPDWFN